jgi:excisionase family DNA binding protein
MFERDALGAQDDVQLASLLVFGLSARPDPAVVSAHPADESKGATEGVVDGDWISTTHAVKTLGVTPSTLYRLINDGQLRAYRIGRVIRIKQADLDAYIESSRAGSPTTTSRDLER